MKIDYSHIKKMVQDDQSKAKEVFDERFSREIDAIVKEIAEAARRDVLDAVETYYRHGSHSFISSKGIIIKRYFYRGNLRNSYRDDRLGTWRHTPNKLNVFNDLQKGDYAIRYYPHTESDEQLRFRTIEQVNILLSKTNALLKQDKIEISWNWHDGQISVSAELGKL